MELEDTETVADQTVRGYRDPRADRWVPITAPIVWTATEIMHVVHLPAHDLVWGTLIVAAAGPILKGRNHPAGARHAAIAAALTGGWMTVADQHGTFAGPAHGLAGVTGLWFLGSAGAWWWAHRHPSLVAARQWQAKKSEWLAQAAAWGIPGAHLLDHKYTHLGEWYLIKTTGTGRRASQVATSGLAETIAEAEDLRYSWVQVRRCHRAGRITIRIQYSDPWEKPIPHPSITPSDHITLPGLNDATAQLPFEVGEDPDTGTTLDFPIWQPDKGSLTAYVLGTRGAGKTILLSNLTERATAARDVVVIKINLSVNHSTDMDWAPACLLTAIGDTKEARIRAVKILRLIHKIAAYRAGHPQRGERNHRPSPGSPNILVIFDEIDEAVKSRAIVEQLESGFSKYRPLGISFALAGQRATAEWMGGASIRALVDVTAVGQVMRDGEAVHLTGAAAALQQDLGDYGDGKQGVWAITPGKNLPPSRGRAWKLETEQDITQLVNARADHQPSLEPGLIAELGDEYQDLVATDAYAHWRRTQMRRGRPAVPVDPGYREDTGRDETPSPAATATLTDADATEAMFRRWEQDLMPELPEGLRGVAGELHARADEVRGLLDGLPDLGDVPETTPEQDQRSRDVRRQQAFDQLPIPRDKLLILENLMINGVSARQAAKDLGVGRTTLTIWLNGLQLHQRARLDKRGSASLWYLVGDPTSREPGEPPIPPRNSDGK